VGVLFWHPFFVNMTEVNENVEGRRVVTGALLNRCPEPIKSDLEMLIVLLNGRSAAQKVMVATGVNEPQAREKRGGLGFYDRFSINCSEVDGVVDDLSESDQLSPRVAGLIDSLRLQFGGLSHYFERLNLLKIGDIEGIICLLDDMKNSERYPVRIFHNVTFVRGLMGRVGDAAKAKRLYDYLKGEMYQNEGQEKLISVPDAKFFKYWLRVCQGPADFYELCEVLEENGMEISLDVFKYWRESCQTVEDFETFANKAINTRIINPTFPFYMRWLGMIESSEQFVKLLKSLFESGLIPDDSLNQKMLKVAASLDGNGEVAMSGVLDLYVDSRYAGFVMNLRMRKLFGDLRSILL